jgi:hypothetical protein
MSDWKSTKYEPPQAWEEQERERNIAEAAASLSKRGGTSLRWDSFVLLVSLAALVISVVGLLYYLVR